MASTNFAQLNSQQKLVWSRQLWEDYKNETYWSRFYGEEGAPVHRFTELTKNEKGTRAVFQLVANLLKDGIIGDNEREGNEEKMLSYEQFVEVDLLNHGVVSSGELSEQKTVIDFRTSGRKVLAQFLADRVDQLMFLTASGIAYTKTCNGATRDATSQLPNLAFASTVTAPTTKRAYMWNGTNLVASNTASVSSTYLPSYDMISRLNAKAKTAGLKPVRVKGKSYYILLVRPETYAALKRDSAFKTATSGITPDSNPFFSGAVNMIDGIIIHEHNNVYNTSNAASGSKWGAGSAIDGTRSLLLGAQALGFADIGAPKWVEKEFDYNSRSGINISKMFGIMKPRFVNSIERTLEDFGIMTCDHFLAV